MYRFTLLLLIYAVTCSIGNHSMKPKEARRIYNGYEVPVHKYPYAVFLLFQSTSPSSCGGSLIMVQAVLTAAHCIDELRFKRGEMFSYFGATVPIRAKVIRRVVDFRINTKYDERTGKNNLGIAFLESRVPLQLGIMKIPLAISTPGDGAVVFSVGWGKQKVGESNKLPDISSWRPMRATKQKILSSRECSKYAGFRVSQLTLCSAPEIGHFYKDDSGNGLVIKSPTMQLVAVLSFVANGVSLHTAVDTHRQWIINSCQQMYWYNCKDKGK